MAPGLKDERARALIASRLDRPVFGHVGDAQPVGQYDRGIAVRWNEERASERH